MKVTVVIRRALTLLAVPALFLGTSWAATASASTSSAGHASGSSAYGWIRLAHLSPNTPPVDVYLYSFGDSTAMQVLKHVAYGTVSPYERVATGEYSVAMRAAGASASTTPVLSTSVTIQSGKAYTVAGMGPESGLRLAILSDRLTTPGGKALVRVIQASLKQHVVNVSFGGGSLASGLAFGSVSSYRTVSPGSEEVQVTAGTAAGDASQSVSLAADTVHTLVVLDGTNGMEVVDLEDAAGNTSVPAGGVATGFGGMAPHGMPSPLPWLVTIVIGFAAAVAGGLRLRRRPAVLPEA